MANDERAGVDTVAPADSTAMRILQLECIIAAKDRELEVVRRECAGLPTAGGAGGQSAGDAAAAVDALRSENAALRKRISDLGSSLLPASSSSAPSAGAAAAATSPHGAVISRALALSFELQRLLVSAAAAEGGPGGAATPEAPPAAQAPPSSSLPRWLAQAQSYPAAPVETTTTTTAAEAAEGKASPPPPATAAELPAQGADGGAKKKATTPDTAPSAPPAPRVVGLNVSGVPMDALAAALARSPVLARMFDDPRDSSRLRKHPSSESAPEGDFARPVPRLPMDSQGRVFLPYPADCFAAVLELLHGLSWWPGGGDDGGGPPTWTPAAAAAAQSAAAAAPPPTPLTWWRDRVAPGREPILRQLIVELGLQPLVYGLAAGAGRMGAAGGQGAGAAAMEAAASGGDHPRPSMNLYAQLAERGR